MPTTRPGSERCSRESGWTAGRLLARPPRRSDADWTCPPTGRAAASSTVGRPTRSTCPPSSWTDFERWAARPGRRSTWCCWERSSSCSWRYCGQEDIAVGVPAAGRGRSGARGADRLLRQYPGRARRPLGQPQLPRVAGSGEDVVAGSLRPSGPPIRAARRTVAPGAAHWAATRSCRSIFQIDGNRPGTPRI